MESKLKRTNSVISSMYHPIGNSKIKTALCMFFGGFILLCLGIGLIVSTVQQPPVISTNETSVLITGPTCLVLGIVIVLFSGTDMCRYRKAQNSVESELNRVISSMGKQPSPSFHQAANGVVDVSHPKIAIVINKTPLWAT